MLQASMSGTHGCSKHPWVPFVGAPGVHGPGGHSWVLKAFMSGHRGCPKRPLVALMAAPCVHECHLGVLQVSKSGPRGRAKRP